jgi:hypothetical protein
MHRYLASTAAFVLAGTAFAQSVPDGLAAAADEQTIVVTGQRAQLQRSIEA